MIVCKQTSGGTTIQSSGSHLAQTKGQPDNNQHKECLGHIARIIKWWLFSILNFNTQICLLYVVSRGG